MANLKEVRERIKSVMSTQQITKAMKMVSAAKLRRGQQAIQKLRPYADKLNEMLGNILSNLDGDASSAYGVEREPVKVLIVLITSNRGLSGAFNTNINKEVAALVNGKYAPQREAGNLTIMPIGKKGFDYFRKRYTDIHLDTSNLMLNNTLEFDAVAKVSSVVMQAFVDGKYDKIEVAYAKFKNAATQFPQVETFLPVPKVEMPAGSGKKMKAFYIFEPGEKELLDYLIPSILKIQFQKFMLDTNASEHGARMTAMDKATENAEEIIKMLKINYNKARQEAITKELSEIVGGAAALGG